MKKLITILSVITILASCSKDSFEEVNLPQEELCECTLWIYIIEGGQQTLRNGYPQTNFYNCNLDYSSRDTTFTTSYTPTITGPDGITLYGETVYTTQRNVTECN